MISLLDIPSVKNRAHLMTVQEYHILGELGYLPKQTELIEGIVLNKMPKSPKHATMVKKIYQFLLRSIPENFHVFSEQPLTLLRSEPEPDVTVVKGSIDDYSESHPITAELIIEVSLSTLTEDRKMADIYAEAKVTEYWIFNLKSDIVEVYTNPKDGKYFEMKIYPKTETIHPAFSPEIQVHLSDYFV